MRGYRRLKACGELTRISKLKEALTHTRLDCVAIGASRRLFGAAHPHAEQAARQFMLARLATMDFNTALLASVGSEKAMAHPMPSEWRRVVREHGFEVDEARSRVGLGVFSLVLFAAGIVAIGRRLMESLAVAGSGTSAIGHHAHFHELPPGTLPRRGPDGRSHDVVSWYATWPGRASNLTAITHEATGVAPTEVGGLAVLPGVPLVPPLRSPGQRLRFVGWAIIAAAVAAIDLSRGRWWHAILMRESVNAAAVRLNDDDVLARDYLFHNSNWIYRPLLTYEAERKGSRILLYFYSTNTEGFKHVEGYPPLTYGWGASNWPLYLVWDEYQADFVRRAVGPQAGVAVVGGIWFHSSAAVLPSLPKRTIAVFDVIPSRSSFYERLGLDFEYYVPGTSLGFLLDIQRVAEGKGYHVLWKRKRHMGPITHRRYRMFAELYGTLHNVLSIDPEVAAYRLVEAADIVLSMPYTSTALIGKELGKPSAYYDPTMSVQKDDRAAHGIDIVSGVDELSVWLDTRIAAIKPSRPASVRN